MLWPLKVKAIPSVTALLKDFSHNGIPSNYYTISFLFFNHAALQIAAMQQGRVLIKDEQVQSSYIPRAIESYQNSAQEEQ